MKRVIHKLIGNEQSVYVPGRHTTDAIRSVSDLLYYVDQNNLDGYLVSVDMEKAFDSVDHTFLMSTLRKYGFRPNFIQWIKVLWNKQVSCVMNNGVYNWICYKWTWNAPRRSNFSIPFHLSSWNSVSSGKRNGKIEGTKICSYEFLLSAFADNATYLVCDMNSIEELIRLRNEFQHNEFKQF